MANMLPFLGLFDIGGFPTPGSYAILETSGVETDVRGRAEGKSRLAIDGSSRGCDTEAVVLYSPAAAAAKRLVGTALSDWENVKSGKDMSSIEGDSLFWR